MAKVDDPRKKFNPRVSEDVIQRGVLKEGHLPYRTEIYLPMFMNVDK